MLTQYLGFPCDCRMKREHWLNTFEFLDKLGENLAAKIGATA